MTKEIIKADKDYVESGQFERDKKILRDMTLRPEEKINEVFDSAIEKRPYLAKQLNQQRDEKMKNIGHNDHLKQIASGIKALMEKQDEIKQDIADRYAEAKSAGFDAPMIRKVLADEKKREKNPQAYDDQRDLFDIYAGEIAPELIKGE